MSNLVKYGSYEVEAAAEEQEELSKLGSQFLKLHTGRNILRVLPPQLGKRSPFTVTWQHYINVPGLPKAISFNCPRMMAKRACRACRKAEELRATGNPADYDLAGEFMAKLRVFVNVIDRENPDSGPQVLAIGKTVHEDLTTLRQDATGGGDFTHPEQGFDIVIQRDGSSKNDTKYTVRAARNSSPLADDVRLMNEWIETQPELARYARVLEDPEIDKLLSPMAAVASRPIATRGGTQPPRQRTAEDDAMEVDKSVE